MTIRMFAACCAVIGLVGCGSETSDALATEAESASPSQVELIGVDGASVGSVQVSQEPGGTNLTLVVDGGLGEGMHAVHLHEVGNCEPPNFKSAGGHWNPTGAQHGRDNPAGAHVGDLANMSIGADGSGKSIYLVPGAVLRDGALALADHDGTSLVIHAGPDDYQTDPSGDSGNRVACAVLADAS